MAHDSAAVADPQPAAETHAARSTVRRVAFSDLGDAPGAPAEAADGAAALPVDVILDVEVPIVVELGHTEMLLQDLLALKPGSVVELDKFAGEPADLVIRGHVVAQGEVIVVDDNFGLRITNIVDPTERVKNLR